MYHRVRVIHIGPGLRVNKEAMSAAASDPLLLATDLADHLVQRGVPFREAHAVVGGVVRHAIESGVVLSELSAETLRGCLPLRSSRRCRRANRDVRPQSRD